MDLGIFYPTGCSFITIDMKITRMFNFNGSIFVRWFCESKTHGTRIFRTETHQTAFCQFSWRLVGTEQNSSSLYIVRVNRKLYVEFDYSQHSANYIQSMFNVFSMFNVRKLVLKFLSKRSIIELPK